VLIFLYGPDTYRSRQKLNEIIEKYKAKHKTGLNFKRLDFNEKDLNELKNIASSSSMFKEKKMIILENVFERKTEQLKEIVEYAKKKNFEKDEETAVVFYEKGDPDKRTELYKFLVKNPNISQEFKPLENIKLESWIKKETEQKGGKIDTQTIRKLAASVGGDLWQMSQEIDKLVLFADKAVIGEKEIDLLVKAKIETNIFNTIDALAQRNKKLALRLLHQHLEEGENEVYLLTMFAYQFRNLLIVKSLEEKGVPYYELAKRTKLHPFVIKKTWAQMKNFSLSELKKIYSKLLELDIAIKTGRIEPKTALDILVMGI